MTDCNHIYDEHGRCFECDRPKLTQAGTVMIDKRPRVEIRLMCGVREIYREQTLDAALQSARREIENADTAVISVKVFNHANSCVMNQPMWHGKKDNRA